MVRGLLVYARAELWLPWSRRFFAFDVCPSGHASGSWNVERQSVRDVAAWSERWKYKEDLEGGSARERALRRAVLEVRAARAEESLRELAGPDLTITNGFPEVPRCVWHAPADAQHAHYAPLLDPEPIHMKEMRGFVKVARLMCEDRRAWFHKRLVFGRHYWSGVGHL